MTLSINGQLVALKKSSSIEYVSENRIFTDADDYTALPWVAKQQYGLFSNVSPTKIKN